MDAASHTSVDNIREIIEKVKYAPIRAPYKVYIIDEVHMLSAGAFNALLKTLEEPPAHVIFILATTDPLKIPRSFPGASVTILEESPTPISRNILRKYANRRKSAPNRTY